MKSSSARWKGNLAVLELLSIFIHQVGRGMQVVLKEFSLSIDKGKEVMQGQLWDRL